MQDAVNKQKVCRMPGKGGPSIYVFQTSSDSPGDCRIPLQKGGPSLQSLPVSLKRCPSPAPGHSPGILMPREIFQEVATLWPGEA